jgi:tripartite-type tricarboxylate transporter receptor subunit TctC
MIRCAFSFVRLPGLIAGLIAEGKVHLLTQFGLTRARDLPDVPLVLDHAKTSQDRQVMELIFAPIALGYPSFMGPGVPQERVAIVRRAFDKAMGDPELIALLGQQGLAHDPATGEELQSIVARMYGMPAAVVEKARALIPSY